MTVYVSMLSQCVHVGRNRQNLSNVAWILQQEFPHYQSISGPLIRPTYLLDDFRFEELGDVDEDCEQEDGEGELADSLAHRLGGCHGAIVVGVPHGQEPLESHRQH